MLEGRRLVIKLTSSNISVVTIALLTLGLQMQSLPPFKRVQPQSSSQESVCVCVCATSCGGLRQQEEKTERSQTKGWLGCGGNSLVYSSSNDTFFNFSIEKRVWAPCWNNIHMHMSSHVHRAQKEDGGTVVARFLESKCDHPQHYLSPPNGSCCAMFCYTVIQPRFQKSC